MNDRRAVILGAGVAGLACAWWLNREGWSVTVLERAAALRGGAYMLGLSGPAYETARRMGLLPALEHASFRVNENVYRDRHGRELMRLRYRDFLGDLPFLALRRTDLVGALVAALPGSVPTRSGVTVTHWHDAADGIVATLSDGSTIEADLLIGADGFRSATRNRLFGPDREILRPLGYKFAAYDIESDGIEADFLSYAEPGHIAEYYALGGGRLAALQVWRAPSPEMPDDPDRWAVLDRVSAKSHPAVRTILEQARKGPSPLIDSLTMVDMPAWSKGRTLLVGDAAHCLTLVSGQGAGIALASAEILARELGRAPIHDALAAHEAKLRPVIQRLQRRSQRMARMFIPSSLVGFHFRNMALRTMPKTWLGYYFINAIRSEIAMTKHDA